MERELVEKVRESVLKYHDEMLEAERYIWKNPQTGFKEWKASNYLKDIFQKMGFTLTEAGNIPGFYFDIDTGREGPTVCIMGELDAILNAQHPECDPQTKAVHACGHHCQTSALIGIAGALKESSLLDRMSGRVRIMAVPAEECLELGDRVKMREEGLIHYLNGKTEFLSRGYLDGVDMALLLHGSGGTKPNLDIFGGTIGLINKTVTYTGKAAHVAGPWSGVNALNAAMLGLEAVNSLRETFQDSKRIRVHAILSEGGIMVNNIPAKATIEAGVRALDLETLRRTNDKVNRALTGAALAIGARIEINDIDLCFQQRMDPQLALVTAEVGRALLGEDGVKVSDRIDAGASDMANLSLLLPTLQPMGCGGVTGAGHGADYQVVDPYQAVVLPAMVQTGCAVMLLKDGAARAREVMAAYQPYFPDKESLLKTIDEICTRKEPIRYEGKTAAVDWH